MLACIFLRAIFEITGFGFNFWLWKAKVCVCGTECHRQEAKCPPFSQATYHMSLQSRSSRCNVFSLLMTFVIFVPAHWAFMVQIWDVARAAWPPHRFEFWHLKSWLSYTAVGKSSSPVWFGSTSGISAGRYDGVSCIDHWLIYLLFFFFCIFQIIMSKYPLLEKKKKKILIINQWTKGLYLQCSGWVCVCSIPYFNSTTACSPLSESFPLWRQRARGGKQTADRVKGSSDDLMGLCMWQQLFV